MALIDKIRAARETRVDIAGHTFTIRRPTEMDMVEWRLGGANRSALVSHVVGWDKVTEMDIIPGGDPHPLPFDGEVLAEWLRDRVDILAPLTEAVLDSFAAHKIAREEAAKN